MAQTRNCQSFGLHRRELTRQRSSLTHTNDHSSRHTRSTEAERGSNGPRLMWDIVWLTERGKKMLLWKRIEPFLPEWPETAAANSTTDYLVGMTLHCFILSVFVLSVAAFRAVVFLFRFACYICLHYAVYKGDIVPISEDSTEPVTVDQVREATILDSLGLKIVLVQNRPPMSASAIRATTTKSPLRNSESDSSQDWSNILSFSSK